MSISRPVDHLTTPERCPSGLSKLIVAPLIPHVCSQTQGFWSILGMVGQLSHKSPIESKSMSDWFGLGTVGQLSQPSPTLSPSASL